ncbi:hypothetical protein JCM4814A_29340 [Streptomyces phaeofaciens JCM 4814]|uniref:Uncharacterized protein n=1 Tax=Streptomyces phaeofaciens TaxID=68254 RepID=A0A918LZJ9_9ACTN|nr:hypothetical protein [Streptomyces phaeofaciens]GGT83989.1 hypothetical protein GCM10010226_73270 [Streptomyces phaeofaciens]
MTDGAQIRAWLDEAWSRTEAAVVLAGGDDAGPLARRRVLAEVYDDDALAELRELTTTGAFTGDICRCFGSLTVALLDARGDFVGSGSHHGGTDISWERGRFRNNLEVADPERLEAFFRRHEVYGRPPDVT